MPGRGAHAHAALLALSATVLALALTPQLPTASAEASTPSFQPRKAALRPAQGPRMSLSQGRVVERLQDMRLAGQIDALMRLRGGDSVLHEEAWNVGKGLTVHAKAEQRGETVHTDFWVSGGDGKGGSLSVRWGLAMSSLDEWLHPKAAGAEHITPPGSVDVPGGKKTRFSDGSVHFEAPSSGGKIPMGVRFVIEMDEGVSYPTHGATLFMPLKSGVDLSYVIKPDYGSLEERMKKRTNLPEHLQGDEGREQHLHANRNEIKGPCGQLEEDMGRMHEALLNRISGWVEGERSGKAWHAAEGGGEAPAAAQSALEPPEGSVVLSRQQLEYKSAKGTGGCEATLLSFRAEGEEDGGDISVWLVPSDDEDPPPPLLLHWSIGIEKQTDWSAPPEVCVRDGSTRSGSAVQTPLVAGEGGRFETKIPMGGAGGQVQAKAINAVIRDVQNDKWYKTSGANADFHVPLVHDPQAAARDFAADVDSAALGAYDMYEFEGRGALSLCERYAKARTMLLGAPGWEDGGADRLNALFVWMRFSQTRQLSWQRRHNTRPMFLSEATEALSKAIVHRWKRSGGSEREMMRMILSAVPRGSSGADGQAIRDEILVIMRKFEIKKRKGTFMEEWHQKLHNNSTPDDITICEAYLRFLESNGDKGVFYGYLESKGITKKRLQTYERPILQEPVFFPSVKNGLINELSHYLQTLKRVHSGADLFRTVDYVRGYAGDGLLSSLNAVLANLENTFHLLPLLNTIAQARQELGKRIEHEGDDNKVRDLLYLDLALEGQARLSVERGMEWIEHDPAAWLLLSAENYLYTVRHGSGGCAGDYQALAGAGGTGVAAECGELREVVGDWVAHIRAHGWDIGSWNREAALWGGSLAERLRRALGTTVDRYNKVLQPVAEVLGAGLRARTPEKTPEAWSVALFTEEVVRGGISFVLSVAVKKLERCMRAAGHIPAWQVISSGPDGGCGGVLRVVPDMASVQHDVYEEPTVLLSRSVSGEEEVPLGVSCVITPDAPDVLAHISVRSRQLGVLFAACFDQDQTDMLSALEGKQVMCTTDGATVSVTEASGAVAGVTPKATTPAPASGGGGAGGKVGGSTKWCVEGIEAVKSEGVCGAKSKNIVEVRKILPDWIKTPSSAVIPFGSMERCLEDAPNKEVAADLEKVVAALGAAGEGASPEALAHARELVMQLKPPKALRDEVEKVLADGKMSKNNNWDGMWDAVKRVWASKWGERAFYSCRRAGVHHGEVRMAVLVQPLVEAEFAFVSHTVNPANNDPKEMYVEVVVGQGEALVGNHPGRALGFTCSKDGSQPPQVCSAPSKSVSLEGVGLIFRSDSNAEDLPGFAGAGLFDSVPMVEHGRRTLSYRHEKLIHDTGFTNDMMKKVGEVSAAVEKAMGGVPQDIEGCVVGGEVFVVQTRPQVGV